MKSPEPKRNEADEAPATPPLKLIQAKVPPALLAAMDEAVAAQDTDRSKFMRSAIRHRLAALGTPG